MSDLVRVLGNRIKMLRERFGITQEELAEKAGISAKGLGELERGKGNPTLLTLEALANGLGITLSELFKFENEELTAEEIERQLHAMINSATETKRKVFLNLLKALST